MACFSLKSHIQRVFNIIIIIIITTSPIVLHSAVRSCTSMQEWERDEIIFETHLYFSQISSIGGQCHSAKYSSGWIQLVDLLRYFFTITGSQTWCSLDVPRSLAHVSALRYLIFQRLLSVRMNGWVIQEGKIAYLGESRLGITLRRLNIRVFVHAHSNRHHLHWSDGNFHCTYS